MYEIENDDDIYRGQKSAQVEIFMILFFLPFSHLHEDRITMLWKRKKNHGIIEVLTPSKLHQILQQEKSTSALINPYKIRMF